MKRTSQAALKGGRRVEGRAACGREQPQALSPTPLHPHVQCVKTLLLPPPRSQPLSFSWCTQRKGTQILRTVQGCQIVLSGWWHKRGKGVSGEEGPQGLLLQSHPFRGEGGFEQGTNVRKE